MVLPTHRQGWITKNADSQAEGWEAGPELAAVGRAASLQGGRAVTGPWVPQAEKKRVWARLGGLVQKVQDTSNAGREMAGNTGDTFQ